MRTLATLQCSHGAFAAEQSPCHMGQLQFKNLPCARWRYDDPADTMRFYALRLRDGGLIKTVTNELIEQGTDWRFLYEIRRELKS